MTKRLLVFSLAFAVALALILPAFAQDIVQGKIVALNKAAKTITIGKTEYLLSDEAAKVRAKVGDMVEATIEGNIVKKLALLK